MASNHKTPSSFFVVFFDFLIRVVLNLGPRVKNVRVGIDVTFWEDVCSNKEIRIARSTASLSNSSGSVFMLTGSSLLFASSSLWLSSVFEKSSWFPSLIYVDYFACKEPLILPREKADFPTRKAVSHIELHLRRIHPGSFSCLA